MTKRAKIWLSNVRQYYLKICATNFGVLRIFENFAVFVKK